MALTGNEILYVQGLDENGRLAATKFQTTTQAIANLGEPGELDTYTITPISTVGNGTLTAAGVAGGIISRSGPVANYSDTLDTAANIIAALPAFVTGAAFFLYVRNTVPFSQTVLTAAGITLSGSVVVPPNSQGTFLVTLTSASALAIVGLGSVPLTTFIPMANTNISTVGAGTLTAAAIVGGVITRSGSVADYTDTTATAAQIIAAMPNANVGQSFELVIKNTVAFSETLSAGSGVTLSGQTIIPGNSTGRFLVTYSSAGAVTIQGLSISGVTELPTEINTDISTVGAGTLTAAAIVGRVITRSGSTAAYSDTTDTAANIIAAMPNAAVGQSFEMTIKNTVAFNETIVGGSGVTLAGQTIIAPLSVGRFLVTYVSAGAVTIRGLSVVPLTTGPVGAVTALVTVGAGTITAAGIAGGVTSRGGGQSGTPFTDTTDTANNIIAALPNASIGQSFRYTYQNTTNATATISGGSGVTVSGITSVPAGYSADFLVTYTAASTITMVGVSAGQSIAASQQVAVFAGSTSGTTILKASAVAGSTTQTLAAVTGMVASTSGSNLFVTDVTRCAAPLTANGTTTYANISGLQQTVVAGTYKFRCVLPSTVANGTGGIKYAFNYSGGAALTSIEATGVGFTASAVAVQHTTTTTTQADIFTQAAVVIMTFIEGSMVVSSGGTIDLQMAQNTSDASNTITLAGATMEFTRIA